ncbi:unnamed protein product, partial [Durusdinium trenchii]
AGFRRRRAPLQARVHRICARGAGLVYVGCAGIRASSVLRHHGPKQRWIGPHGVAGVHSGESGGDGESDPLLLCRDRTNGGKGFASEGDGDAFEEQAEPGLHEQRPATASSNEAPKHPAKENYILRTKP